MSENKTSPTKVSVALFIAKVGNETQRKDAKTRLALMKKVSGDSVRLWGPTIVAAVDGRRRIAKPLWLQE